MRPGSNFAGFAAATIAAAGAHVDVVRDAWEQVGVMPGASASATGVLRVRRTGGFAGLTTSSEVDLASRGSSPEQVRDLLGRADPAAAQGDDPRPDMYVYEFQLDDAEPVLLPEHRLTDELAALARDGLRGPRKAEHPQGSGSRRSMSRKA